MNFLTLHGFRDELVIGDMKTIPLFSERINEFNFYFWEASQSTKLSIICAFEFKSTYELRTIYSQVPVHTQALIYRFSKVEKIMTRFKRLFSQTYLFNYDEEKKIYINEKMRWSMKICQLTITTLKRRIINNKLHLIQNNKH